jgi:hypothetical protein
MFLELDVAAQINQLEVQPNEAFWICKQRLSGKGLRHIWKVWRGNDEPATLEGETSLQRDLRHSINMARNGGQGVLVVPSAPQQPRPTAQAQPKPQVPAVAPKPVPERQVEASAALQPATKQLGWAQFLISQTNALTDAYATALLHANQYGTTVKPEDVRTLLVTAFINLGKTGAANVG